MQSKRRGNGLKGIHRAGQPPAASPPLSQRVLTTPPFPIFPRTAPLLFSFQSFIVASSSCFFNVHFFLLLRFICPERDGI